MIKAVLALIVALGVATFAMAQGFSGLARVDVENSTIAGSRHSVEIDLALSQGIPYRVFTLSDPARLVIDFRKVDWSGVHPLNLLNTKNVSDVRVGGYLPGSSRLVADLNGPFILEVADMRLNEETGAAHLQIRLERGSQEDFTVTSGVPTSTIWDFHPEGEIATDEPIRSEHTPMVIVLDPGHGGIDPGAEVGDIVEKDLILSFARQLKETLLRSGEFEVVLTRNDDSFVSLERRVAIAHRIGADVFLSLHADSLGEGGARGATIYTLSESASDAASAALAERHDREDMLAGVDLTGTDDVVADILMDLARMETQPRADLLARALVLGIREMKLPLNSRPLRGASFSVLKSPDIPSILLELGFLSNDRDLGNLNDPEWRNRMAVAISDALKAWIIADATAKELVRQ